MEDIYTRTRMLIGDGVEKLKNASVIIFGCGGVGSYTAEAVARAGVGKITVVDGDTVSPSNINRQLIATGETVGKSKAEAERDRIKSINPVCRVSALNIFYNGETCGEVDLSEYDYVCDAIDSVSCKLLLAEKCSSAGIPLISSMGTGNKLDPTKFEIADIYETSVCPLARVMRRELKKRGIKKLKVLYSKEIPRTPITDKSIVAVPGKCIAPASISFVPGVAGLIIAGEIIRDIAEIN